MEAVRKPKTKSKTRSRPVRPVSPALDAAADVTAALEAIRLPSADHGAPTEAPGDVIGQVGSGVVSDANLRVTDVSGDETAAARADVRCDVNPELGDVRNVNTERSAAGSGDVSDPPSGVTRDISTMVHGGDVIRTESDTRTATASGTHCERPASAREESDSVPMPSCTEEGQGSESPDVFQDAETALEGETSRTSHDESIVEVGDSDFVSSCEEAVAVDAQSDVRSSGRCVDSGPTSPPKAAADAVSNCSTEPSVTCGSPFIALGRELDVYSGEVGLYPDLSTSPAQPQSGDFSPVAGLNVSPSAPCLSGGLEQGSAEMAPSAPADPAASEYTPACLSASQVSISEGPFFFETESKPSLICLGEDVAPFSEAQLSDYYHNQELNRRHEYAQQFLSEHGPAAGGAGEFEELVAGYRRAGALLRAAAADHGQRHAEYERRRSSCWDLVHRTVAGEADCDDGRTLSAEHEFRCAVFDAVALEELRTALSSLRQLLYDTYCLHAYSLLLAKLQVETYLQQLTGQYPDLLASSPPAGAAARYPSARHQCCAAALRGCLAVLFAAQRQGAAADAAFAAQTRQWLLATAALLLRVSTVNDHLFLLHQTLRCPSGSVSWAAPLLQPPAPHLPGGLDHTLTALALILEDVSQRDKYLGLEKSRAPPDPGPGGATGDEEWVMLEDEEQEAERKAGYLKLQEADLIALFNQLPWADLVRHLLKMTRSIDGADIYDPARSSSGDTLRLFACASQLIGILAAGLSQYSGPTHRQLNKRLCHQLLHLVHYVTDHWESYSATCEDDMATKGRLLVEYDSFVCRAAVSTLSTPHLAVWHFLASFPFGRLTARTAWKLLWLFHTSGRPQETSALPAAPRDRDDVWATEIFSPTFHALFEHQLVHMSQSEVYFRLTALANMAMARSPRERTFVKAVARDLVQVSFVTPTTRELCSRSGRDLLAAVCNKHPFVMSYVMTLMQEHMPKMGKIAMYLASGLPLQLWRPSASDIAQVCAWLAEHPLTSVESQLAQLVLSLLDWGVLPYGSGQLALPAAFHRHVALAVVATQAARAPETGKSAGIVNEGRRQVGALAALVKESPERQFQEWAWRQVSRLSLHALDAPDGSAHWVLTRPERALADVPTPDQPQVAALEAAVRQEQPLAVYTLLLMTSEGHSLPRLYAGGLARVGELLQIGRPAAVAHLLEVLMPLFVDDVEELCREAFPSLLQTIVSAHQSYLKLVKTLVVAVPPESLLQQMAGVIEGHVTNYRCYGQSSPVPLVMLWLRCLTCLPAWSRDSGLLYLLDNLLRAAFANRAAREQAERVMFDLVKAGSGVRQTAGLSSLLSWMSGGTLQPLLPAASLPEVPWLAWFCLRAETREQAESGLWHDLICTLCEDRQLTLDQALKRVCAQQRLPQTPVHCLALYRWAQQALDTDLDCPLLPALWQHFFALYLARVYDIAGRDLGSVGDRFLEGMVNVQYQKRLKRRLQETAEHYSRLSEHADTQDGDAIDSELTQRRRVAHLFTTYTLWLEEPRLRGPEVYLPDLPANYLPGKLVDLLQEPPTGAVWEEYVNFSAVARISDACLQQRRGSHHDHRAPTSAPSTPLRSDDTPANRIIKRLGSYDARAQLPAAAPFRSPVPELSENLFAGPDSAVSGLREAFLDLSSYASWFCGLSAEHSSLDSRYIELVPELYTNAVTRVVQRLQCERAASSSEHRCSGPATVVLECETAQLNGGTYHRIDENRQQAGRLERAALDDPPQSLGVAAVRLETFIKWLVRRYRAEVEEGRTSSPAARRLQTIGARLFHHVIAVTSEETRQCPSVNQLLAACLDLLGQTFVQGQPGECGALLEATLRNGWLVGELAAHLTPAAADADTFIHLYATVTRVSLDQSSLVTVLLSKFDLDRWLPLRRPSLSQRSALIRLLVDALSALGSDPSEDAAPLHEAYRRHLVSIHRHEFPEHYGEILHKLLEASKEGRLSAVCWYDFVNVLSPGPCTFMPQMDAGQRAQTVASLAERPSALRPQEMVDTCKLLSSHFLAERLESGLYGLYPRYRPYVAPLSVLLGLVASSAVMGVIQRDRGTLSDTLMADLWLMLRDTFGAWLSPLPLSDRRVWQQCAPWLQQLAADKKNLPPWIPGDGEHARPMLDMFLLCVMQLHSTLPAGRSALSHLWEHYCSTYAVPSVQEHVRQQLHLQLLQLPWSRLQPQLADAERTVQLLDVYLPEAHSFVAQVVVQLPWKEVVEAHQRACPSANVRLHGCLFSILVKVAFEPKIRQSGALFLLLSRAEAFSWHLLDAATYKRVLSWYVMSCEPSSVLETEAREPVDVALMGFLQVAAGHVADATLLHPETGQKRAAYISAVVRLLANTAARHKNLLNTQRRGFSRTLLRLLRETESVTAKMVPDEGFREAVSLVRELLQCASSRAPAPLQQLCATEITKWVAEESTAVLLCPMLKTSGTIIYDMNHLAAFWEAIITALFAKGSGVQWPQLTSLCEFPAASLTRLLTACLESGCLFVLHLHLLQRQQTRPEPQQLTPVVVSWLTEFTALSGSCEMKLCLLLDQSLQLLELQADAGQVPEVCRHVRALGAALQAWGEDRDATGLLGAIGLGRRSPLSPEFRLLCRILAATMLAQLGADGSLCLEARQEEPPERLSTDSSSSTDSKWGLPRGLAAEAYAALERLTSLRSRRDYAPHLQAIEEAVADVLSAATTFRSCRSVLAEAVRRTYCDPCLHQIL